MQVLPEVLAKERFCKIKIDFYISPKEGSDRTGVLIQKRKDIYNSSMVPTYVCL
jgi:hypothetical protein